MLKTPRPGAPPPAPPLSERPLLSALLSDGGPVARGQSRRRVDTDDGLRRRSRGDPKPTTPPSLTVQVTTHAVLNAVRRLVMILFTSYFFGEPRTLVNTIGVLVAVAGVCAYALASKRAVPAPHRTEAFDRTV
jgi:hypothetical protein